MPQVIQSRLPSAAKTAAASAPNPTSMIAAIGRPRSAIKADTAIALAHEDNISRWPGPATKVIHSHSTAIAAKHQNTANGQPPVYAAAIAIGASTAADTIRNMRLLLPAATGFPAAAGPETGSVSVTGSGSGLGN